jgi:hypothetical protein
MTGNCFSLKQIEKVRRSKENGGGEQNKDRHKDQDKPKEDGFGRSAGSVHTFTGVGDRRDKKFSLARWLSTQSSQTSRAGSTGPSRSSPGAVTTMLRASSTRGESP